MSINTLIKSFIIAMATAFCLNVNAQAPAQELSKYVDGFTGDFKYSNHLLTLSGPNGETFPLTMNYKAGVRMNQAASWVGLGWDLNVGEIKRKTNGMPDDWFNSNFKEEKLASASASTWSEENNNSYFGPIHFDGIYNTTSPDGDKKMDLYTTSRGVTGNRTAFKFPDYDSYYVSGPDVGGEMRPYIFEFAEYVTYPITGDNRSALAKNFTKKPQFRFTKEPMAKVESHLSTHVGWKNFKRAEDAATNHMPYYMYFPAPTNQASKAAQQEWHNRNGDIDVHDASNYIEYFTNEQIYNHHSGTTPIDNFLDYEVVSGNGDRNSTTKYDPNGIGAFRVTTPNGMTYHYSLPVYMRDEKVTSFDFNSADFTNIKNVTTFTKNNKYAYTWKLTAVTGYMFDDTNNNSYPDEGDRGYWINVNYTKWSGDFKWKSPYYNYGADVRTKRRNNIPNSEVYLPQGTVSEGTTEIYYPEYIKSATQTAYFIKDVRADEHSKYDATNSAYTPKLFLKYVVLMDNKDVIDNNIFTVPQAVQSTTYSNLSSVANTANTLSTEDYNYYKTSIESHALKTIDFEYDYHLNQKTYNNINNSFTETAVNAGTGGALTELYKDGTNYSTTADPSLTGKLTLNKVTAYNLNHENIVPAHEFEYSTNNPDYNHEQHDIFGYYKADYDAETKTRFITTEHDKVDAWSLATIKTPIGSEISINYESDRYSYVGYDSELSQPVKPSRVFRLSDATLGYNNFDISYSALKVKDDDINYYYPLATEKSMFLKYGNTCGCGLLGYHTISFSDILTAGSGSNDNVFAPSGSGILCHDISQSCSPSFSYGHVYLQLDWVYGGGLRVADISITEPQSLETYKLTYDYENGIATTEPDNYKKKRGVQLQRSNHGGDRHALPATIGYSKAKITVGDATNNIGSIEFSFKNYIDPYSVSNLEKLYFDDNYGPNNVWYNYSVLTVSDMGTMFGKINSIINYDNNENIISQTAFEYGDHNTGPFAKTDELFYNYSYTNGSPTDAYVKTVYWKKTYNTHLSKKTEIKDGITTVTEINNRDNFTGQPTEVTYTISGKQHKNTKVYAYESNPTMGAKTTHPDNLNLLTAVQNEKEANVGNAFLRGGVIREWDNSHLTREWDQSTAKYISTLKTSVWAPTKNSVYNGTDLGVDLWKNTGFTTLFAGKDGLNRVEQKDMKDGYSALKYGYDDRFKIAEIANCNYASFAFSGFESLKEVATGVNHFDGEIQSGASSKVDMVGLVEPHTGEFMAKVLASQSGPTFRAIVHNETVAGEDFERGIQVGRTYVASVWVHKDSPDGASLVYNLDGSVIDNQDVRKDYSGNIQVGDWIQMNLTFTIPANYVSSGGPGGLNDVRITLENTGSGIAYYDDFMVHPVDAKFSGYVYDEKLGLTKAVVGNDNFYTRFEHDNSGKVIAIYKETKNGEKIITSSDYNFKGN